MKNRFKYTILISCALLSMFSCENTLDINENPNLPTEVDKNLVFTAAQASLATVVGGFLTNYGGFMAQYHTQSPGASQYTDIDAYDVNASFTNNFWIEIMAGGIDDLDFVIAQSIEDNTADTYLAAKVLRAYIFQVLTDFYGDIPYADVLPGSSNLSPELISQENIYQSLITSVNEALLRYENNKSVSIDNTQDVVLGGDMQQWIQFANTLKLKMYIRLAYTPLANETEVLNLLTADNFIENDISFDLFSDESNKRNPFAEVQLYELSGANNSASNSLLKFYQNNNDPRLSAVYVSSSNADSFLGLDQGSYRAETGMSFHDFATPNVEATKPVFFMTVAESNFLQAEALIRYSNAVGAQEKYEDGIRASFENYNLLTTDAETLITNEYTYKANSDIETAIKQVIVQKWASLAYVNNIEAYFEQLRTGYPEFVQTDETPNYTLGNLIPSKSSRLADNITPSSMFYPDNEVNTNKNITQKATGFTEEVWWAKK